MRKLAIIVLGIFILSGIAQVLYSSPGKPELRKEIVKVKYVDAQVARSVLVKYISPKGKIQTIRGENRLLIEDVPEIMEKLLSILKELDVRPVDIQFNIEVILGSMKKADLDKELKSDPVMRELQSVLKFKSYKILDSSIIKAQENKYSSQRMGGEGINLRLYLRPRYIKEEKSDIFNVYLELAQDFGLSAEGKERTLGLINTTLTLKSGERTVVGVSKLNTDEEDRALILILSGKVLK
ncbi:MAG: secretin N-terminal domain-containing protein [Candidatus Aminicenantaceae bacterium]